MGLKERIVEALAIALYYWRQAEAYAANRGAYCTSPSHATTHENNAQAVRRAA